ncbi:molybdate ABC transporter substrate-binding protein [Cellulomonas edaphi]|uniref:Molybdate ABC transporter substrate-binding protein n=1 Tax=Cellulomonas edaphi TaxID=3053468 RepID=A0ABT7S871_9CELL|nr:molybdate ABC transporter substrate-binding protein [Cellulomons edaphi]MDM7831824.1 molybdate ABC transporter substrate-binding protein [Cellulomons edaphi]
MTRTTAAAALVALLTLAGCSSAPVPEDAAGGAPSASADGLTGELTIFAAASLQPAFDELTAAFAAEHPGVTVDPVTYDGSSTLATQLVQGARADVFASADETTMAPVVDAGLVDGAPTTFTTNSLQILVPPGNPQQVASLADLATLAARGGTVVLCAPEVPCGSAARKVLDAAGVELAPASEEQNVSAVLTKVTAGEADAGLVYRTDVLRAGHLARGVDFPEADEAINPYPIAALGDDARPDGHDAATARAFVELVLSGEGQKVLAEAGFGAR